MDPVTDGGALGGTYVLGWLFKRFAPKKFAGKTVFISTLGSVILNGIIQSLQEGLNLKTAVLKGVVMGLMAAGGHEAKEAVGVGKVGI